MTDSWEDLFEIAAGRISTTAGSASSAKALLTCAQNNNNTIDACLRHEKRKRKKRKKTATKLHGDEDESSQLLETMIHSRMDPISDQISSWPSWISIGKSLVIIDSNDGKGNIFDMGGIDNSSFDSNICQKFTQKHLHSSKQKELKSHNCLQCHSSPLNHSLELHQDLIKNHDHQKPDFLFYELFIMARNARCCASICMSTFSPRKLSLYETLQYANSASVYASNLYDSYNESIRYFSTKRLTLGEQEILSKKINDVKNSTRFWYDTLKSHFKGINGSKNSQIENSNEESKQAIHSLLSNMVNVVISCDALYYRLYYLQIIGLLPILSMNGKPIFLPHPTTYFGLPYFTWDIYFGEEVKNEFLNSFQEVFRKMNDSDISVFRNRLSQRFNLSHDLHGASTKDNTPSEPTLDPLSYLHQNRIIEGIIIFWKSGWMNSKDAELETKKLLKNSIVPPRDIYDEHETLAPSTLKKWRDSCRDLLCNLYAYAAISPKNLVTLKDILLKQNIDHIVEMGAGTGYVATLLKKYNIDITAFDLNPTSSPLKSMNEYHGHTPPFTSVQKSDSATLTNFLGIGRNAVRTALLLCYAPPQSNMAEECLRSFMSLGGRILLHIGEFRGLTGSARFEKLLLRNFEPHSDRLPCLSWGNDVAEISIWVRKPEMKKSVAALFLCVNCHKKEAIKQCRLSRDLAYCSEKCFISHEVINSLCLSLNLIPCFNVLQGQLEFSNSAHFRSMTK